MSFKLVKTTFKDLHKEETKKFALFLGMIVALVVGESVVAGTNATFAQLEADAQGAIFGPLGQTVIYVASLGGALMAAVKGAWLFAGLGIAVAGLLFGAQSVANGGGFAGLI